MSYSVRPHRLQPTRLHHPWDSPGKNTGVGCHFLLQCMKVKSESEVTQSCQTLRDPMDCSLPGSSIHGIFQARAPEWVAIAFSHPYITTGKTTALTRWTFVGKVMSLLFNMLSRLMIAFLPRSKHLLISWLQSPSAVILEPRKIKFLTVSIVSPTICHEVIGPDAMILMLNFKPAFSLSSFISIKRLFSSSSLSPIRVVSSACLGWKPGKVKVKLLSRVRLFSTPWTVAYQAPLSMGFSRQECWNGLPFPSPGDLPDTGIEPGSPALQTDAFPSEPPGKPGVEARIWHK